VLMGGKHESSPVRSRERRISVKQMASVWGTQLGQASSGVVSPPWAGLDSLAPNSMLHFQAPILSRKFSGDV